MSRLENAIATIAPHYALRRARARAALEAVRAYEAAAKGRRTDGWRTPSSSANSEIRGSLSLVRDRARALVRDNPYAARGVSVLAAGIVGYGIKTTLQTPNKKTIRKVQDSWLAWAESSDCDADGLHNMYGLQELAVRTIVESGEVLIRRVWREAGDGLAVPMQIQVLEPDYLDSTKDGAVGQDGNLVVQGVEFDKRGRRVAYWIFDQHPGDACLSVFSLSIASRRVPAEDILHVHRVDRAGQVRGVTWFAPIIIRLRDFDEYEDAQLVRQKVAACYTAFVRDMETPEASAAADTQVLERMEPGIIEFLPAGKDVTLASPPGVQGYSEYCSVTLHAIAAGLGVPYEALTTDFSQVNFTSGRMGRGDFHSMIDSWQWNMFIPKFCAGVVRWFTAAATLAGLPAQGITAKFTTPRRVLVDPTREVPAIIKAIRAGLQTQAGAIREMGYEPEEFFSEIAATNAELDRLEIILDSDPRRVSGAGQAQAIGSPQTANEQESNDANQEDE